MAENVGTRVTKNTLMLYSRQILILFVGLYTVRVVLDVLGVEDYGVYTVIGGIVSFFSFLSGTMASATQRFFSFALGQNDEDKLKSVFTVNGVIYIAIAVIAFILLETIGLWFVTHHLNIPETSFDAACIVYHFSVLTFVATIIATPFMGIIIAHEDMQIYAYISILEAILKLTLVFLLMYLSGNKLILYGFLLFITSVIITIAYIGVCAKKYKECQFRIFYWNRALLKEVLGFTSWTLFGQVTTVLRNQGVTILLNQMFNPVVVAAKAIANNIANYINVFANNFNVGLYPPIIKSYAANEKESMLSLIFNGSKITFFLMWVFALPLFIEMDFVLEFWLKNPPPNAALFTRLALIEVVINSISLPLATAARAPGKMKIYELTLGLIQLAILPMSWFILLLGGEAYTTFIVAIIANIVMFFVRLFIVSRLIKMSSKQFLVNVFFPVLVVIFSSSFLACAAKQLLPNSVFTVYISIVINIFIVIGCMYYFALNKKMRIRVKGMIMSRIKK